jgi:hypothetical protein
VIKVISVLVGLLWQTVLLYALLQHKNTDFSVAVADRSFK